MSPEDRDAITTSIANLWTFNAVFISQVLGTLEDAGALSGATIEGLLQRLDAHTDHLLEGTDDQLYAANLLATVRQVLADRKDE